MQIRRARAEDYDEYVNLFVLLETGDPPPGRDTYDAEVRSSSLVACRGHSVAGWIYYQCLEASGYVRHLMVAPWARRQGIARELMKRAGQALRAAGIGRWELNVKPTNRAALELYGSLGMVETYRSAAVRLTWPVIEDLPESRRKIRVGEVDRACAARLEELWDLPSGLLERSWKAGVRMLAASGESLASEGLALFAPSFPGAFPFRARDVSAMRSLLEAMRPLRDDSFGYVQIVCESAPELVDALVRAGAAVHLEIIHLEGAIPR